MLNLITEKLDYLYSNDCYLIESFLNEGDFANEMDDIIDSYRNNIGLVKKVLLKHGVNVKRVESKSSVVVNSIKSDIRKGKDPKIVADRIVRDGKIIIKYELKGNNNTSLSKKIGISLAFCIIILFVSTISMYITTLFFGTEIGFFLTAIILCPVIEESSKKLSIEQHMPWMYTGIFAGLQVIFGILSIIVKGGKLGSAMITRTISTMFHFSTTSIQKYFDDRKKEKSSNFKFKDIPYLISVFLHATYNLIKEVF